MKARILLNPRAGRGRGAKARSGIESIARRHGVELVVPEGIDALRAAARAAVAEGCERLLVAGGDGTYHQAAQELARTECALVPIGVHGSFDIYARGFEVKRGGAIGVAIGDPIESGGQALGDRDALTATLRDAVVKQLAHARRLAREA